MPEGSFPRIGEKINYLGCDKKAKLKNRKGKINIQNAFGFLQGTQALVKRRLRSKC
jgi:hypothetical protein